VSPPPPYFTVAISLAALLVSLATLFISLRRERVSRRLASIATVQKLHLDALRCLTQIDAAQGILEALPSSVIESAKKGIGSAYASTGTAREKLLRIIDRLENEEPTSDLSRIEVLESLKRDFQSLERLVTETVKACESLGALTPNTSLERTR
jgi:hypothetical protein